MFVKCDFTPFSSARPDFGIRSPWHGVSTASLASHPPADSCSLTGVGFGQGRSKDCLQPFMGWYHLEHCSCLCFGLVNIPFKIIAGSQIGCSGALKSSCYRLCTNCSCVCTSKFFVPCSTPWH